jgi:fatty acid desaturase
MHPRFADIALHAFRLLVAALAMIASFFLSGAVALAVAAAGAVGFFMASFALAHDALHGSLKLSRRVNAVVLSFAGIAMLFSGHAMRRGHLKHHARPLAADDVEGAPARGSFLRALAMGPVDAIRLRIASYHLAPSSERPIIIAESVVSSLVWVLLLALPSRAANVYGVVGALLQLWMGAWAAWVPHNAPSRLIAVARCLARSRSAVLLSLAYHDEHHEKPWVPCAKLGVG